VYSRPRGFCEEFAEVRSHARRTCPQDFTLSSHEIRGRNRQQLAAGFDLCVNSIEDLPPDEAAANYQLAYLQTFASKFIFTGTGRSNYNRRLISSTLITAQLVLRLVFVSVPILQEEKNDQSQMARDSTSSFKFRIFTIHGIFESAFGIAANDRELIATARYTARSDTRSILRACSKKSRNTVDDSTVSPLPIFDIAPLAKSRVHGKQACQDGACTRAHEWNLLSSRT